MTFSKDKFQMLSLMAIIALAIFSTPANLRAAGWTVYEASMLPYASDPPFVEAMSSFIPEHNKIIKDTVLPVNKWLWMDTGSEFANQFKWAMDFADYGVSFDEITVVMRVRGHSRRDHVIDFDMQFDERRTRVSIQTVTRQPRARRGRAPFVVLPATVRLTDWNIFRFTMSSYEARLYLNENPNPMMRIVPVENAGSPNKHFRFGDGDTGNSFGADIDWIIWDVTGSFSPGMGLPIPAHLIPDIIKEAQICG